MSRADSLSRANVAEAPWLLLVLSLAPLSRDLIEGLKRELFVSPGCALGFADLIPVRFR